MPILKKTLDLYKLFYGYSFLFPKKDRHTIGATCERYLLACIELLSEVSYAPKERKRATLLSVSTKVETLKVLIRLLRELNIIDQKKYLVLQGILQEIGKMLGGWIKASSQHF